MGSTDTHSSCPCAAETVPGEQVSTRLLGRFDPLPSYGKAHQVSSPLSQSPAAPGTHHPLKGNERLEAPRKPSDPLSALCSQLPVCPSPAGSEQPACRRAKAGSGGDAKQLSSCISHIYSPFSLLHHDTQKPLKPHIPTQPGKLPFTDVLQIVSTSSEAQQPTSPGSADFNNFLRQMGCVRVIPRVLPLFFP